MKAWLGAAVIGIDLIDPLHFAENKTRIGLCHYISNFFWPLLASSNQEEERGQQGENTKSSFIEMHQEMKRDDLHACHPSTTLTPQMKSLKKKN